MDQDPAPDPDSTPDPDPTPDPSLFLIDFKDAKSNLFKYFFLITCPETHLFTVKNLIFAKITVLKCYFAGIISVRSAHL
jgi:hypothetical protein